ncbi:unnamed protein product, partial [Ascophyllum nodosum]
VRHTPHTKRLSMASVDNSIGGAAGYASSGQEPIDVEPGSSPRLSIDNEAFGTNASKAACKNTAARQVIDAVKKVVEHLNKSNVMKVKYEDMQHLM